MSLIGRLRRPEVAEAMDRGDEAGLLAAYQKVWDEKPALRAAYERWYGRIASAMVPGATLEVGAGTGNLRRWLSPRPVWTLDVLRGPGVDVVGDALRLPLASGSLANVLLFDTLHHLAKPLQFVAEAARALRPGGRLILVEPYVSAWGSLVWRYLHHERVDFGAIEAPEGKGAWEGNAAIPTWLLSKSVRAKLPLRVARIERGEFLAYPLTGGFSYRSLLPGPLLGALRRLESGPWVGNRLLALRVFAVLEKDP